VEEFECSRYVVLDANLGVHLGACSNETDTVRLGCLLKGSMLAKNWLSMILESLCMSLPIDILSSP